MILSFWLRLRKNTEEAQKDTLWFVSKQVVNPIEKNEKQKAKFT